jgi:catechol 2,3-dioxygenase-like lactoylglutathione lyase family enzyme
MEGFVAQKLNEFETGKISRRKLIETLTAAATTAFAGGAAGAAAAESSGLDTALVNHISYTCPDFKKAADWYSMVFNLEQVGATKNDVALPFGKKGEQPYNVSATDVPLTHLIIRTRPLNAGGQGGGTVRKTPKALIEHMAYTVADFDREKAKAQLIALGVKNVRDGGLYSLHMDDVFGYDVQVSGLANNALTDG